MLRLPPLVAFVVCVLIWGTTWVAIRIGYGGLDAVWGGALRFLLAGGIVAILAAAKGLSPPMGRRQVGVVAVTGVMLFGLDYGLIYWGEQWLPSGLTAILFATMPLFTVLVGSQLLPTERVTIRHLAGILLSLAGLVAIFYDDVRSPQSSLWPAAAIVASAAACAVANVVVRRWGRDIEPLVLNAGGMLVGGVGLVITSLLLGEHPGLPATGRAWASLLYLAVLGSVISFVLYWDLLKIWPANRATLLALLTPVVALVTGTAFDERLTSLQWIGSLVVLAGVALSLQLRTIAPVPRLAVEPTAK